MNHKYFPKGNNSGSASVENTLPSCVLFGSVNTKDKEI
jgi:hypothetical protein